MNGTGAGVRSEKAYLALVEQIGELVREEVSRVREAAGWAVRRLGQPKTAVQG